MEQHTLLQREESPRSPAAPSLRRLGGSRHITHWDPEDLGAWEAGNKGIARRNLLWSVVTVHLGYSVWTLWPVLELLMPQDVYGFSTSDKFLLGTIATLFGAFLRMPYALASAIFGGRNWATFSAIVLLIPAIGTTVLLTHPGLPLWPYLVCAALTGLGGGNFASSMSNANAFYPHRLKGSALGIAGGVGNLGVPAIQLVGLLAIATVGERKPYLVCALYVVLVAIAVIGVSLFMNNVEQHRVQVNRLRPIVSAVLSTRDTWLLSLLYLGTFGSFIGFSFVFGQVLQTNFLACGQSLARDAACRRVGVCRAVAGGGGPDLRWPAGRSSRWKPLDPYSLCGDDARRWAADQCQHPRRPTCRPASGRYHGRLLRLLRRVVRPIRVGQRVCVQDDSDDF